MGNRFQLSVLRRWVSNLSGARIPVQLPGIHLQGVLYVAGDVRYAGHLRVYGGVVSQGAIVDGTNGSGMLEAWYNHDLREGLVQGMPLVFVAPWKLAGQNLTAVLRG
jgi:hypothetical protein